MMKPPCDYAGVVAARELARLNPPVMLIDIPVPDESPVGTFVPVRRIGVEATPTNWISVGVDGIVNHQLETQKICL